ncbi:MAG TPA: hypothetical protein VNF72_14180 [Myxococcota bacterium]|nr:hypothetical protein [Myxococcota bacterium]
MSPKRRRLGARSLAAAAVLLQTALLACAPKQRIPLEECVNEKVVVYVDGRMLEVSPAALELRSDQPHKLYIKRPGEPPYLVVLEPTPDGEGRPRLEPADPCKEIVAVGVGRELTIEVDEEKAPAPRPESAPGS